MVFARALTVQTLNCKMQESYCITDQQAESLDKTINTGFCVTG